MYTGSQERGSRGSTIHQQATAVPALEDSRSHDLTFWHWAASGKCRRLLPGGVLSLEEKGTGLEANLVESVVLVLLLLEIECLWIIQLCFCCVAQTNRCGGRDGSGGWGCVCGSAGGRPRLGHVDARSACSSPVRAFRRALAALCSRRLCELRAFLRLRLPGCFPLSPPSVLQSHPGFLPPRLAIAGIFRPQTPSLYKSVLQGLRQACSA